MEGAPELYTLSQTRLNSQARFQARNPGPGQQHSQAVFYRPGPLRDGTADDGTAAIVSDRNHSHHRHCRRTTVGSAQVL